MTHEDFIKLIGQDLVVDYLFIPLARNPHKGKATHG